MSKIEISNDRLAAAVRTKDGMAAFKSAADNGQTRLALDVLADILPTIVDHINGLSEAELDIAVVKDDPVIEAKQAPTVKQPAKQAKDSKEEVNVAAE